MVCRMAAVLEHSYAEAVVPAGMAQADTAAA